jgi:hypothetical protein
MTRRCFRGRAGAVTAGLALMLVGCSSTAPQAVVVGPSTAAPAVSESLVTVAPTAPSPDSTASVDPAADTAAISDSAPKLCELITEQDAVAAFEESARLVNDDSYQCFWKSEGAGLKGININRDTPDLAEWRAGHDNDSWEPNDYGEEGFSGKVLNSIEFRIGDTVYDINVNYSTKGDPDKIVNDLAVLVLSRL